MDLESETSPNQELNELRNILNANEKIQIQKISHTLDALKKEIDPDEKIKNYLNKEFEQASTNPKNKLRMTINNVLPDSLKAVIKNNPGTIIDTLYPVIGNIVSKYVRESLKDFMDSINSKIENQLPYEKISRKYKAKLKGLSEEEYLLQEAQKVKMNGVLLIEKGSGIIVKSLLSPEMHNLNSDLFAGLLIALQDFGRDCVKDSNQTDLDQIEFGENKVLIEKTGSIVMAVLIKGTVSDKLLKNVRLVLGNIIQRHKEYLENFNGSDKDLPEELSLQLKNLLFTGQEKEEKEVKKNFNKTPLILALLLIGVLTGYITYKRNTALDHINKHVVFKTLPLTFITTFSGFMNLSGQISSKKELDSLKKYMSQLSIGKISYKNLQINNNSQTNITKELKSFLNQISSYPGVLINITTGQELLFHGFVKSSKMKELVEHKIRTYFQIYNPKLNIQVDSSLFSMVLYFDNGQEVLSDQMKSKLKEFTSKKWQGKSYFKLLVLSSPVGTYEGRLKVIDSRARGVRNNLISLGFKEHQIQTQVSLNYDGIIFDESELKLLENLNKSPLLLKRSTSFIP